MTLGLLLLFTVAVFSVHAIYFNAFRLSLLLVNNTLVAQAGYAIAVYDLETNPNLVTLLPSRFLFLFSLLKIGFIDSAYRQCQLWMTRKYCVNEKPVSTADIDALNV